MELALVVFLNFLGQWLLVSLHFLPFQMEMSITVFLCISHHYFAAADNHNRHTDREDFFFFFLPKIDYAQNLIHNTFKWFRWWDDELLSWGDLNQILNLSWYWNGLRLWENLCWGNFSLHLGWTWIFVGQREDYGRLNNVLSLQRRPCSNSQNLWLCYLIWQKEFVDEIKLRILKYVYYSRFSMGPMSPQGPYEREVGRLESKWQSMRNSQPNTASFENRRWSLAKECGWPVESGKDKEQNIL